LNGVAVQVTAALTVFVRLDSPDRTRVDKESTFICAAEMQASMRAISAFILFFENSAIYMCVYNEADA
jgi:hypothetical protein